jgi:hypothetical protein
MRGKDMSEATFTFLVDEALKTEFSTAAKARDLSGAQLLRDFMREFVQKQRETAAHDVWFRRQEIIGDRPRLIPGDKGRRANISRIIPKFNRGLSPIILLFPCILSRKDI